ncbi:MAG TPA: HXXEE domain-containing protein [Candidatus Baltobacteraceae bacterium]|nr:HXXEE domain-containing protein [Candidatus Baltobacteraceae bacterium]
MTTLKGWLVDRWQWPAGALMTSIFLIAVLPVFYSVAGLALTLVFAQLPAYMIHQFEEHHDNCFCTYVNRLVAGGRIALTPMAAFWINSIGVWGVDLAALFLARYVSLGLGVIAVDLALVNGTLHLIGAIVRREYNPGAWTSLLIFFPLGIWTYAVLLGAGASRPEQILGFSVAVAIHIGIVAYVRLRVARLAPILQP